MAKFKIIQGGNDGPPPPEDGDPGPGGVHTNRPPHPPSSGDEDTAPSDFVLTRPIFEEERISINVSAGRHGSCYRQTLEVLGDLGFYQKSGMIVDVLPQQSGRLAPMAISEAGLSCRLSDHIRYVQRSQNKAGEWKERPVDPPKTVVTAIHRAGHWDAVPRLRAITCHPVVRENGSVQSRSGYDTRTQVLSTHDGDLDVQPLSQNEALHARETILDVVDEFPFVGVGADVWLAAVLTPLVRPWCGPAPMFAITSSTPSSGKSRLADIAAIISCGGQGIEGGMMPPTDDEWQKRIISLALFSPEIVYFDNVQSGTRIGSPVLDMALTRDRFSGRILGHSKMVDVELLATWIAAGNNISAYGDTARRVLMCRIEPMVERPECREFRIPDILGYTRRHRKDLLRCALGILSGWLASKGPPPTPPLGSFELWSDVVRGAIIWAGGADVAGALAQDVDCADDGAQLHRALLEEWHDVIREPVTSAQILERCSYDCAQSELASVIAELCPGRGTAKFGTARLLSARLRAMEGRVREVNGFKRSLVRVEGRGAIRWTVSDMQ